MEAMVTTAAPVTYMTSLLRTLRALAAGGPLPPLPTRTLANGQVAVQVGREGGSAGMRGAVHSSTPASGAAAAHGAVWCPHALTLCASMLPTAHRHVARMAGVNVEVVSSRGNRCPALALHA